MTERAILNLGTAKSMRLHAVARHYGLRCATTEEVACWLEGRASLMSQVQVPPRRMFCQEARRSWCLEQRAAGLCVDPEFSQWEGHDDGAS